MAEQVSSRRGLRQFFSELRRRHVLETAGIYLAGGWLLIEAADILFPVFSLPDFFMRILVFSVFAGFPVILFLSWIFDISLRGLIRTDKARAAATISFDDIPQRSIAVLPFSNMSGSADNDYFGDGLAEELLNLLAKIESLKVAARTSSFALRDQKLDAREIGSTLGVWHVLEGSVRQAGQRIRITAQLIEAPTGYHLWSETFDRDLDDIFAIQDEIATAIVDALQLAIAGKRSQSRSDAELPTENIEAYQYFLRATYLWQRRGADAIGGAIRALEQAVELDPDYAEAYARLAAAEAILHEFTQEPREPGFARAEAHARKAIALDPGLGEPHGVLGYMALRLWKWRESELHFARALQLQDTLPTLHQWFSNLLNDLGEHERAEQALAAAHALDPLSPTANNLVAFTAFLRGHDDIARKHSALAREYGIGGGIPDIVDFVVSLRRGDRADALTIWRPHLVRCGLEPNDWLEPVVDGILDSSGREAAGKALRDAIQNGTIDERQAFFHAALLADELVFDVAQAMLADHVLTHVWLFLPEARALITDKRFFRLMDTIGLVDYWRAQGTPPAFERALGERLH
ncbi:MAG: hypothetical protein HKN49_10170 [Gammaproteobacteria bacterium]|nr:hypothetical protein [Gammaproteobacteria bacterium]